MNNKKMLKKETRELVFEKIATALADMKGGVKKKQFDKKLQKATNMLAKDIARAAKKESPKKAKRKEIKAEKIAGKKRKSKKAAQNVKPGPAKMNNNPVVSEVPASSENIVP